MSNTQSISTSTKNNQVEVLTNLIIDGPSLEDLKVNLCDKKYLLKFHLLGVALNKYLENEPACVENNFYNFFNVYSHLSTLEKLLPLEDSKTLLKLKNNIGCTQWMIYDYKAGKGFLLIVSRKDLHNSSVVEKIHSHPIGFDVESESNKVGAFVSGFTVENITNCLMSSDPEDRINMNYYIGTHSGSTPIEESTLDEGSIVGNVNEVERYGNATIFKLSEFGPNKNNIYTIALDKASGYGCIIDQESI